MAKKDVHVSYAHGVSAVPLMGLTVNGLLNRTIAGHSENDALVVPYQGVRWSYGDLGQEVNEVAAGLVALGLEPGERVGIWAPNMAEWVADHDMARNDQEIKKCSQKGIIRDFEADYRVAKNQFIPVEINATLVETKSGPQIICICREVSQRKKAPK